MHWSETSQALAWAKARGVGITLVSLNPLTVPEIRASFDRAGAIDDIASVQGKDLDITKEGDKVVVSFKYAREIPLAGPAYLVYRFNGRSD